jgi:hypothetical protein
MELNSVNTIAIPSDRVAWGADLDPAGQRRLWLFLKMVDAGQTVIEAFEAAQKVERFLTSHPASLRAVPSSDGARVAQPVLAARTAVFPYRSPSSRQGLLDSETKERFALEAALNNDNRHLAKTFNLTVRQAHAVRISLSRRVHEIRTREGLGEPLPPQMPPAARIGLGKAGPRGAGQRVRTPAPTPADLQARRALELALQEEFLKNRPPAAPTIDDVVRYLRQIGDIVVRAEAGYCVNGRMMLSESELVGRANRKRLERRQPAFQVAVALAVAEAA